MGIRHVVFSMRTVGQRCDAIADCESRHAVTDRGNPPPSFMSGGTWRLWIFEPGTAFPERDTRGTYAAAFEPQQDLSRGRLRRLDDLQRRVAGCCDHTRAHTKSAPCRSRGSLKSD